MRINIRLGKKTVIHNSVELCTPENWRRLSFAFFTKYLPLLKTRLLCASEFGICARAKLFNYLVGLPDCREGLTF